jgi:hypothetical protein
VRPEGNTGLGHWSTKEEVQDQDYVFLNIPVGYLIFRFDLRSEWMCLSTCLARTCLRFNVKLQFRDRFARNAQNNPENVSAFARDPQRHLYLAPWISIPRVMVPWRSTSTFFSPNITLEQGS